MNRVMFRLGASSIVLLDWTRPRGLPWKRTALLQQEGRELGDSTDGRLVVAT